MITEDIQFIKSILPEHYTVQESKKKGSVHCKSLIGIVKSPEWGSVFQSIKSHFGDRFQEVFHNTCTNHVDFTIYLKSHYSA